MNITLIMTFLNEGENVKKTVESIRAFYPNVKVLLFDDASTDSYDYNTIAKTYNCLYYKSAKNLGVANARMTAVNLIDTDNFIIMDSHMKMLSADTIPKVLAELEKYPSSVITVTSKGITEDWEMKPNTFGVCAAINMTPGLDDSKFFALRWVGYNKLDLPETKAASSIECPIILGAFYGFNKEYFLQLGGLTGLQGWGGDEELISIKYWMSGGSCRLITSEAVAHLYRTDDQQAKLFTTDRRFVFHNKLFIFSMMPAIKSNSAVFYNLLAKLDVINFNNGLVAYNKNINTLSALVTKFRTDFPNYVQNFNRFIEVNEDFISPDKTRKKAESSAPPLFQQIANAAEAAKTILAESAKSVATGQSVVIKVPDDVIETRFKICQSCTLFNEQKNQCKKCGCNMKFKTTLAAMECPEKYWGKYNTVDPQ